ncbi:class Ib ribonucleoside-diphosphate reductase assembly flavoprotein NrdI [Oceanicola sp. D3]|uniref:class Ib ribonucleoside-diphosphate reductase assembly flavoprotein NrdI n=1 Tax=Oceanicola sp. D3 TaxID=2587163 RepID=UPI00111F3149|nr:class Ib ribonucleoside-diphosphate reductase assembly flavoprotein NrdI [Oceanicola sp. D3]QDC10763.1 class Ib ribonucleoside-diphosphate reductase assembly flavoprotein NrdI [Oceanicola sp. D3]
MSGLVYYSSRSNNTHRLIERLDLPATRLPQRPADPLPAIDGPFVLICPTFADGQGRGAVPKPVIRLLNDAGARRLLRGVIAGGNRNFGASFALAGKIIAAKCNVPLLYRFELAGTPEDTARIRDGLARFWAEQEETPCLTQA